MSVTATITKRFHRQTGVITKGFEFSETMTFVDVLDAFKWGEDINANHENVPYHILTVVIDNRNFMCYDLRPFEHYRLAF